MLLLLVQVQVSNSSPIAGFEVVSFESPLYKCMICYRRPILKRVHFTRKLINEF
jgi:hypothetical protein